MLSLYRSLVAGFLASAVGGFLAAGRPQDRGELQHVPRQVLAFYYPWYGNPRVTGHWVHWSGVDESRKTIAAATHYPLLGAYDSHDARTVDQHVRWARQAGITGFIVSWWGQHDFSDDALPLLLDAARRYGLKITIYYETAPPRAVNKKGARSDLEYLRGRYFSHPAWLTVNGQPVVFVYGRAISQLGVRGWGDLARDLSHQPLPPLLTADNLSPEAAAAFAGVHEYSITDRTQGKSPAELRQWAGKEFTRLATIGGPGRIHSVTIIPGYDDSKLSRPQPRPITDRWNGETYRTLWRAALEAAPDWILISTWNEWHEGSEIEPSIENSDRELKTTSEFARRFLAFHR